MKLSAAHLAYLKMVSEKFYNPGTENDKNAWYAFVREHSKGYRPQ